jgi:feruloyl esterase
MKANRTSFEDGGTVLVCVVLLALGLELDVRAQSASSSLSTVTATASRCTVGLLSAPRIKITSADAAKSSEGTPRCVIYGEVPTEGEGAPPGLAHFRLDLPFQWNGKLVFDGGGGFDGFIRPPLPSVPAQGYATLSTDSGHSGGPDGASIGAKAMNSGWMTKAGEGRNEAALADYLYRAIHQVRQTVSPIVAQFYGTSIRRSYFWGCSNGGREAMLNAMQNPEDFDGFIAGDPSIVPALGIQEIWKLKVLRDSNISYATLQRVDAAVMEACDSVDGVKDGLIQNPAACSFDFGTLVKGAMLSSAQAEALIRYTSAIHDDVGAFIEPGGPISAMSGSGRQEYTNGLPGYMIDPVAKRSSESDAAFKNLIQYRTAVGLVGGIGFGDLSLDIFGPQIFDPGGIIRHDAVTQVQKGWAPGIGDPSKMREFFRLNRKLIIYHGLADHDTTPYESQLYYEALARANGGLLKIKRNARLFLAPGMEHCQGGQGPNSFDPLEALDNWVGHGTAPAKIIAKKFVDDDPALSLQRSMPLCPYPGIAHYDGHGNVNDWTSWACIDSDSTLTRYGLIGRRAGLGDSWR